MRAAPLLVALTLLLVGCDDNPFKPSDVKEITWKLESIERTGSPVVPIPNPENYTLKLGNDGRLGVRADCNSCSGTYTLDGSTLKIGQMACTLVGCGLGSLDGTYAALLNGTSSIALTDGHLVIRNGAGTLRYRN